MCKLSIQFMWSISSHVSEVFGKGCSREVW